ASGPAPNARSAAGSKTVPGGGVAAELWQRWSPLRPTAARVRALNTALVLLAEHELASSTLAVRVAASARAAAPDCLLAGLGTLNGALHGYVPRLVQERLLRGQAAGGEDTRRQPGFGHPVHRHGDPRAAPLLAAVYAIATPADRELVERTVRAAAAPPNSDFALGALCYVARMPAYAATAVFAVARTAGWIAHAAEEYTEPAVRFRGRAVTPAVTRPSPRRGSYPAGAPPRELPGRRRAAGVAGPLLRR
ncbi:MAG TPA: citrate/2-methylcitrate synthase, partial [Trebonia sp.]|nr:citrate/2-methylcitrate synthase [Trebonia sp.]